MKRILALFLSASLFLLPALSLAEATDSTLSLYVNPDLATDDTTAAIADVVNALGFRVHAQDGQGIFSIALSGSDVLVFALETNESGLYLASNLFGEKTVFVSAETVNGLLSQLPVPGNGDASLQLNLQKTTEALMGALEMNPAEITSWDESSDRPSASMVISVSAENANKVLDALKEDLLAADLSALSVTLRDGKSVPETIDEVIAAFKGALPEGGEFLSMELGIADDGLVYWTMQVSCLAASEDGKKTAVVTVDEARTTKTDSVLWDGGVTLSVEGSDTRAYLATSLETMGENSRLDLVLNSVDDSDQMTPLGAFFSDARHTADENELRIESLNALYTYDEEKTPSEVGEVHLLYTMKDFFTSSFSADVQQSREGPVLFSLRAQRGLGEAQPSRITEDLYPVSEFSQETLSAIVNEVITPNLMNVAMGALSQLPPSAMNLVGGLLGQ